MSLPNSPHKPLQPTSLTMKDVAAHAGVSIATVSRVMGGKGGVRPELELAVRKAVQELGYRPNQAARRLRERKAKIIGVLVTDIQIPFFASIVVGIDRILQEAGYLPLLGNSFDSLVSEQAHLNNFLSEGVSGVIFAAASTQDTSNYDRLRDAGIPLVAIDRSPGDMQVDTVQVANLQATSLAVSHFIQEGHRRIALIAGPSYISTAVERQAGYEQALRVAGIPHDPTLIQLGGYTLEGGYRAMRALMEKHNRPTAVFIANNVMTLGALQYVNDQSLEIPGDIAVIGYDDMPWAASLRPPLTVVAQPDYEIGVLAARLMLDRIREPNSSFKHITLDARLVLRASCNCERETVRLPSDPSNLSSTIRR
jgi:LacI family transcriptional regulator, galactose operon repressor